MKNLTTRNEVITELDKIEAQLKNMNVDCDNNGRFDRTESHEELVKREDELMQELQKFPI